MTKGGNIDDIGIVGMDADTGNGLGVFQADVFPGFAAVNRFIYAVALHDISAELRLPRADIYDVGIGCGYATAPTEELVICPSVTGFQVNPPSIVFQSPPPTAPK
jgi:hypothetical protein